MITAKNTAPPSLAAKHLRYGLRDFQGLKNAMPMRGDTLKAGNAGSNVWKKQALYFQPFGNQNLTHLTLKGQGRNAILRRLISIEK